MKILVTGALGHIGSRIIREIPKFFPNANVVMIDNLVTQRFSSLFNLPNGSKYKFIEDDIIKIDLEPFISDCNAVLHLAAITDAAMSFKNREQVEYVNYNGTVKVANGCAKTKTPLIHISSTSVYGTQEKFVDEDCTAEELNPQSPYAETKLREERYLQDMGTSEELKYIICRFGTICGISSGMRFHTAVNKFCWQAVMGTPITVWKTAMHQVRPYLSLNDAVNGLMYIIRTKLFDNTIYNIVTENLTVKHILDYIREHVSDVDIKFVDTEIMNQLSYNVSNKRFQEAGYRFSGNIKRDIKETIHLLKNAGGSLG